MTSQFEILARSQEARERNAIAVVAPFFNEAAGAHAFLSRLEQVLDGIDRPATIVCVDDGSRDRTLPELLAWSTPREMRVVELSRNFGKESALTAGIDEALASGASTIVLMDSDLQHPPELIPALLQKVAEGADVVVAKRASRDTDGWVRRTLSRSFYRFTNAISEVEIEDGFGDFRVLTREAAAALASLRESKRFMKGLFAWTGFRTTTVDYTPDPRTTGTTRFKPWRLWNLALEGITSFSTLPLRVWTYLGAFFGLAAIAYGASVVVDTIRHGIDVPGYASIFTSVLFLGGVQLIGIGVLGEYLGRTYVEAKRRPPYLIRRVYGREVAADAREAVASAAASGRR